jgi:hypothetical protein
MKKSIEKLIPFIEENFITFPLLEEGIYIPSVNIGFFIHIDEEIFYDKKHVLQTDLDIDKMFIVFVNEDIPNRRKKNRYISFGVSYKEGIKEEVIKLEPLYEVANKVINNFKH